MEFYIVIPAYNEASHIGQTLQSLVNQTHIPKKVVVVNDCSTDGTESIIADFVKKHSFISLISLTEKSAHLPGSKVINAFTKGLQTLDDQYDILCKFDADLIFPNTYLERIHEVFQTNPKVGIAGGFCYIEKNGRFVLENLTNKDHVRGALKAYRKACFEHIGQLKLAMGWDTVDELLAQYHGWAVYTDENLHVKHLKPTGNTYTKTARFKQGEAFYRLHYGFILTCIASAKLAFRKKDFLFFIDCLQGFFKAQNAQLPYLVSKDEGQFIRHLRWRKIKEKFS